MALDDDMQVFKDDRKTVCIRTMMEEKITEFVWSYICQHKHSCPAKGCHECVSDALNQLKL